jgi:hypothetical protein
MTEFIPSMVLAYFLTAKNVKSVIVGTPTKRLDVRGRGQIRTSGSLSDDEEDEIDLI